MYDKEALWYQNLQLLRKQNWIQKGRRYILEKDTKDHDKS